MNQAEIHRHLQTRLPKFEPIGNPIPLDGGLLNYVWRIQGKPHSIILKYAPPFIASNKEISLSQSRIEFEAKAMNIFQASSQLSISNADVRLAILLDFDPKKKVLLMEDVGSLPDLFSYLSQNNPSNIAPLAQKLGAFLARLHTQTANQDRFAKVFDNEEVQASRLNIQYNLATYCKQAAIPQATEVAETVFHLGKCLQAKGQCVIMGDFWPPSILVNGDSLRIIDWELSHYGWPVQDIAHLIAHLWMLSYSSQNQKITENITLFQQHFLKSYKEFLNPSVAVACVPFALEKHFGAEILMRTIGPFKEHYFFEHIDTISTLLQGAIDTATQHILSPKTTNTFGLLNQ